MKSSQNQPGNATFDSIDKSTAERKSSFRGLYVSECPTLTFGAETHFPFEDELLYGNVSELTVDRKSVGNEQGRSGDGVSVGRDSVEPMPTPTLSQRSNDSESPNRKNEPNTKPIPFTKSTQIPVVGAHRDTPRPPSQTPSCSGTNSYIEHQRSLKRQNQKIKDGEDLKLLQDCIGDKLIITKMAKLTEAKIEISKDIVVSQDDIQRSSLTILFQKPNNIGNDNLRFRIVDLKRIKPEYQKQLFELVERFEHRAEKDFSLAFEFYVRVLEVFGKMVNEKMVLIREYWNQKAMREGALQANTASSDDAFMKAPQTTTAATALRRRDHSPLRTDILGFGSEFQTGKIDLLIGGTSPNPAAKKLKLEPSKNLFTELFRSEKTSFSRYKNDFENPEKLGKGGFGSVYKVKNRLDGNLYAVKIIDFNSTSTDDELRSISQEVNLLSKLNFPFIVRYYQAWVEERPVGEKNGDESRESFSSGNSRILGIASPQRKLTDNRMDVKMTPSLEKIDEKSDHAESKKEQTEEVSRSVSPHPNLTNQEQRINFDNLHISFGAPSLANDSAAPTLQTQPSAILPNLPFPQAGELEICFDAGPVEQKSYHSSDSSHNYIDSNKTVSDETSEHNGFSESIMDHQKSSKRAKKPKSRNNKSLFIQMEYCENQSLKEHIKNYKIGTLEDERVIRLFTIQIISALNYIHKEGFIHRDLKPGNIFLDANNNVKLGDFGLARQTAMPIAEAEGRQTNLSGAFSHTLTNNVGTSYYISPEQKSGSNYNSQSDMYSLGVVLLELLLPSFRSEAEHILTVIRFLHEGSLPDYLVQYQNHELVKLMLQLVNKDPHKRPTSSELLHKYNKWIYDSHVFPSPEQYKGIIGYIFSKTANPKSEVEDHSQKTPQARNLEEERTLKFERVFKKTVSLLLRKFFVEKIDTFPVTVFQDSLWLNFSRITDETVDFEPVLLRNFYNIKDLDSQVVFLDKNAEFNYQTNNPLRNLTEISWKTSANRGRLFSNISFPNPRGENQLAYLSFFKDDKPTMEYKKFSYAETLKMASDVLTEFVDPETRLELWLTSTVLLDALFKKIKAPNIKSSAFQSYIYNFFQEIKNFDGIVNADFIQKLRKTVVNDPLKAKLITDFMLLEAVTLEEFKMKLSLLFPNYEEVQFVIEEFQELPENLACLGIDKWNIKFCAFPPYGKGFPQFHSGFGFYFGLSAGPSAKQVSQSQCLRLLPGTLFASGGRMENLFFNPNLQGSEIKFGIGFTINKEALLNNYSAEALNRRLNSDDFIERSKLLYQKLTIMLVAYHAEKFKDMLKVANDMWKIGLRVAFNFKEVHSPRRFYEECAKRNFAMVLFVKRDFNENQKIRVKYLLKNAPEQDIDYKRLLHWLTVKSKYYENFVKELTTTELFKTDI